VAEVRGWGAGAWPPLAMGVGLVALGALSVVYRDFALVWQPVPAGWPAHAASAVVSGLILIAAGGLMLARRASRGGLVAAAFIGLWVLVLHLPRAAAHPLNVGAWQAVCESLAMATGAFIVSREARGAAPRAVIYVMGACYVVFGLSHFVYADFTTTMVPPFLPMRPALTYVTGTIHLLSGLAVLAGFRRRLAAMAEALMMSSFVLLVHIPRVAAHPHVRMEQTALCIALVLTSAAWALAASKALAKRA
jgi:uncharacterized membrane protein